jgi:prepilin-type N-terminal cleavage/methylation domain-containing protein
MTRSSRRGFTLVETIFAIFIFAAGALALAAATAVVIRMLAQANLRERAARVASNRLENVRSLSCGTARSGSELVQGIQSSWTVAPSGALTAAVATVSYSLNDGPRTDTYSLLFRCPP